MAESGSTHPEREVQGKPSTNIGQRVSSCLNPRFWLVRSGGYFFEE
jgi:hypothetical protein